MSDPLTEPVSNPKPDRAALEKLASYIRTLPLRPYKNRGYTRLLDHQPLDPSLTYFDWANWTGDNAAEHSCGTYGCVAGHAATIFPDLFHIDDGCIEPLSEPENVNEWCLTALGLTMEESRAITLGHCVMGGSSSDFLPEIPFTLDEGTPPQAADRILAVLALAERRHAALDTPPSPSVPSTP